MDFLIFLSNFLSLMNIFGSSVAQNIILLCTLLGAIVIGWLQININNYQVNDSRPVILRDGFINKDWSGLENGLNQGKPFLFTVQKNIATDVHGHLILNGKRYDLLFAIGQDSGNSKILCPSSPDLKTLSWIKTGGYLCAVYDQINPVKTTSPNEVYIEYKDISGNSYYTRENDHFLITSKAL